MLLGEGGYFVKLLNLGADGLHHRHTRLARTRNHRFAVVLVVGKIQVAMRIHQLTDGFTSFRKQRLHLRHRAIPA